MLVDSFNLFESLTPKRVQLFRSISLSKPSSIRELALIMERDVKNVWEDLHKLVELELVGFESFGRSKRPIIKKQIIITIIEVEN